MSDYLPYNLPKTTQQGVYGDETVISIGQGGVKPSELPDTNARPMGNRTKIETKDDAETIRSLTRENEATETLAKNGYQVEQNPQVAGSRNPDYKIEGEIFDCYSPNKGTSSRNIGSYIEDKVINKAQTSRIILNLDDWKGNVENIAHQLAEYPIDGLLEVKVIKDGIIATVYSIID